MKDIVQEAHGIIREHTAAYMTAIEYLPTSISELYEDMVDECAYILSQKFIDGEYTPMEYNAIRNELGKLLWNLFEEPIHAELNA